MAGKIYRHGGKKKGSHCPGSDQLPSFTMAAQTLSVDPDAGVVDPSVHVPYAAPGLEFLLGECRPLLIEHIPKSARPACSTLLASLLDKVCKEPLNPDPWIDLLAFGPAVLNKPYRGGRRSNVGKLIKQRVIDFQGPASIPEPHQGGSRHKPTDRESNLAAAVTAKIEQGNLKAAVRILCSDESPASPTVETLEKLKDKHPPAPADKRPSMDQVESSLCIGQADLLGAIKSFPCGSSGGLDGIRPQHLKDLVGSSEAINNLIPSLVAFVNVLLSGVCPPQVQPVLFGGNLCALSKKDGGVRPIAVGSVWRRLSAKCANSFAIGKIASYLSPLQVGVCVPGGAEAAAHAARRFITNLHPGHLVMKLDFSNAFNTLRRDCMLEAVHGLAPEIFNFCKLAYDRESILNFQGFHISSSEGNQQGDPLGPVAFSMTIHPILLALKSKLVIGYLDDLTAGGDASTLARDFDLIQDLAGKLGLSLNIKKCEIISGSGFDNLPLQFLDFRRVDAGECELLGAPLFAGRCLSSTLSTRCEDLERATVRLSRLQSHDALLILKNSLSAPKLMYTLRSSPCSDCPELDVFDGLLRTSLSAITNVSLDGPAWVQATLPVSRGGLGIRSVALLAPSAFLASAAATRDLQDRLLPGDDDWHDLALDSTLSIWSSRYGVQAPVGTASFKQANWDQASIESGLTSLDCHFVEPYHRARLLAVRAEHSGDWLHAWPISSCGLRLDDEAIRIAVGLRLGVNLCAPHTCPCGAQVDARGNHGLACRRSAGRLPRHTLLNDVVHRAFSKAGIPAVKEPSGLLRSDGKRPDGCTLIPWHKGSKGRCLAWDVTVPDTLAPSHLTESCTAAGAAAESAASFKVTKYQDICRSHDFCAVAIETMGAMNQDAHDLVSKLGNGLTAASGDPRETTFLYQRLSVIIQKCNAISFKGSFVDFDVSNTQ